MIRKIAIALMVAAGVLAFLSLAALRVYVTTEDAQGRIQSALNQLVPGRFAWGDVSLGLLDGRIEIRDIHVWGAAGEDVILVKRLWLDLSLPELIRGRLHARDLVLEQPRVFLRWNANADLELVDAFVAPEPAGEPEPEPEPETAETGGDLLPFNICVESLRLSDGYVEFEIPDPDGRDGRGRASLDHIDIALKDGDLLNEQGVLDLHIGGGRVDMVGVGQDLRELRLKTTLDDNRFFPTRLDAAFAAGNLEVSGALARLWTDPLLDADIRLNLDLAGLRKALDLETDLAGEVTVRGSLKGLPADLSADLQLASATGAVAGHAIRAVKLDCGLKERLLQIRDLQASLPRGDFRLKGQVDFRKVFPRDFFSSPETWDGLSYEGTLTQEQTALADILGAGKGIGGHLSSTVSLRGAGVEPERMSVTADLRGRVRRLFFPGMARPVDVRMTAGAALDHGRVTLGRGLLQSGPNRVDLSGGLDPFSGDLAARVSVSAADLSAFLPAKAGALSEASLTAALQVAGTLDRPGVEGKIQGMGLRYEDYALGDVEAVFRMRDGQLRLERAALRNGRSQLTASGSLALADAITGAFPADPAFTLQLAAERLFLEDFLPEMRAELTASGRFSGSLQHPEGELAVDARELDLGVQRIESAHLSARVSEDAVRIAPLSVTLAPGEEIRAEGLLSLEQPCSFRIFSRGIPLERIDFLKSAGIRGGERFFCDLSGAGSLQNPEINGTAGISDLGIGGETLQDIRLSVHLRDQELRLATEDLVRLDGRLHLGTTDFSVALDLDNTDLSPFLGLAGYKGLEAAIRGMVRCEGNLATPEGITAEMDLGRLELGRSGTRLVTAEQFRAGFRDGRLTLPRTRLQLAGNGFLDIGGNADLEDSLDFSASGEIPVTVVRLFTAEAPEELEGTLRVRAECRGTLRQPEPRMTVELADIGLVIPVLMQKLEGVSGRVEITPAAVALENITGRLETGRMDLNGRIELENLAPSRFEIRAGGYALPLQIPDTLEVLVNTDLVLSGTPAASRFAGEVLLLEGEYTRDVDVNLLEIIEPARREEAPAEPVSLPYLENLSFDVALRHRHPFVISNNLAELELKPDLRLTGTLKRPLISGRAEVASGVITYQKREFEIEKGLVDFVNPYRIEPTIEIDSSVPVREWIIFLNISGTPDNLKYELRSEPPEPRADILSLMVFGKTSKELMANESGQSAKSSQILADYLAKELQDSVKGATGLDTVTVEYQTVTGEMDAPEMKVTVGKELSRRVGVRYGMEKRGGEIVQSTAAEYKFLERLIMSLSQDSKGDYGAELNYRIEFR
ncbi:MAG: translocation/assembly module TamB domain-containing protein [Thermodesulfobacteriota bacterium]